MSATDTNNENITLLEAAMYGHTEICKQLLEHGADANAKDKYGDTPLRDAAKNGHTETCRLLLRQHGGK